jgi:hypothetical protein
MHIPELFAVVVGEERRGAVAETLKCVFIHTCKTRITV